MKYSKDNPVMLCRSNLISDFFHNAMLFKNYGEKRDSIVIVLGTMMWISIMCFTIALLATLNFI